MKRRSFLKTCIAGSAALLAMEESTKMALSQEATDAPNVLWIDTEDVCPDLGCYGNELVHTPNLDRLAAEGAMFTHAYTTAPVCSASRSAIATGMYQTTIGAHHHRSNRNVPLPESVPFFTEYLRRAGYFTVNGTALHPGRQGKFDYNFSIEDPFDGTDWSERAERQPFFAQLHFHEVHRVFSGDSDNPVDPDQVELPPYYPDYPITRLDWALYLETIQNLDKKVGRLLERLEEEGLAENTVVFFTGDHGRPMVRGKQWLYEGGIHIPLLVRWPGHIEPGTVRDDLVSAIDLTATWMALAGEEVPEHMQGRDLFAPDGDEREYIFAARDRCDETDDRIRCVRSKRYKYIRNFHPQRPYNQWNAYKHRQYPVLTLMEMLAERGELEPAQQQYMAPYRPPEELYDLESDPHEVDNLGEDADDENVVEELRAKQDEWICETGDKGQIPEHPRAALRVDRVSRERWEKYVEDIGFSPTDQPQQYLDWWRKRMEEIKG